MPARVDGPASPLFAPVPFRKGIPAARLAAAGLPGDMAAAVAHAPQGECVCWGIPFRVGRTLILRDRPVTLSTPPVTAPWFVFLHTTGTEPLAANPDGLISPMRGYGRLAEPVATYVLLYQDGEEAAVVIRRRHQIGMFRRPWGENCVEAVAHAKPHPIRPPHEQPGAAWGWAQTRTSPADGGPWVTWLWAWENPRPRVPVVGFRFEPVAGTVLLFGVSAGRCRSRPLRWEQRQKAVLRLPAGTVFEPSLDADGRLRQVQLDLGQVISAVPRPVYPREDWAEPCSYNVRLPDPAPGEVILEYTAHADARFHLAGGRQVRVSALTARGQAGNLRAVPPARQRVRLRVVEAGSRQPVAVRLHVHGEAGEYLAPVDRHRLPNAAWFEDYSVDFLNQGRHPCTYIPGETTLDLPLGRVYIEVSKGFEIRPLHTAVNVTRATRRVELVVKRVLPWRQRGWVSADTHVHFLSPPSALLEGAGEGVNVVNLLASQWGELMTNAGDFDGRTTFGSREAGGDGEHLVRVGTENRQHVLGHISLLGYNGPVIAPMTSGGPDESALGDPVAVLLTEWARQCRRQGGIVVLPHFPNPRLEGAAAVVSGLIDGVEMTSWGNLYGGIDPYSLSDWYRYLNCGMFVAAVGGTDKMSADTAVGTVRTYARLPADQPLTYEAWKDAVRAGHTFVTYGPLLEFRVEGQPPGSRLRLPATGGTVSVEWEAASVTVPMSRIDLVVNGEVRASGSAGPEAARGHASVRLERSSWLALLVRGHYPGKPEIVAAHSSPVMVTVGRTPFMAAADAVTILDQIEGALVFLDTIGTRAETQTYRRLRLVLTAAHRKLHNRMHRAGLFHGHPGQPGHAPDHQH